MVKELVENAIDAGATAVAVEIRDGGISFLRVTDNGSGIEREQVPTAFLRHATSKIRRVEDLFSVQDHHPRGSTISYNQEGVQRLTYSRVQAPRKQRQEDSNKFMTNPIYAGSSRQTRST